MQHAYAYESDDDIELSSSSTWSACPESTYYYNNMISGDTTENSK